MPHRYELLRNYQENQYIAYGILKSQDDFQLDEDAIWRILHNVYECSDNPTELLHKNLSVKDIITAVENFEKNNGNIIAEIVVDVAVEIESDVLEKANLKFAGSIWTIHKMDKDPFPSNPHAHNYDKNLKMDLSNGDIYLKKKLVTKMPRSNFIQFRELVKRRIKGIILPPSRV